MPARIFACMSVLVLIATAPAFAADDLTPDEKRLVDLLNTERAKADLPPLRVDARLMRAARAHSAEMARRKELAHELDGKGPGERLARLNYDHAGWGENCAAGQRTPAEAMTCWMNSEGHKANILRRNYKEVGVGLARSADGVPYWTQIFGIPSR